MSEKAVIARVWLLFSILLLMPFGSLPEFPLLIAAVIGLADGWRQRGALLMSPTGRLIAIVFLAYWLPEFCSAFDSLAARKTWQEVAADLRFLPFAWFVMTTLKHVSARSLLLNASAVLIAVWILDALVQAGVGMGLGGRVQTDRISGIFSDDNLKLGPVLATLAPLTLWAAWQRWRWWGMSAAWLIVVVAILLAGARAAWLSFAIVTLLLLWKTTGSPRRFLKIGAVTALAGCVVVASSYMLSERFQLRVDRSLLALSGIETNVDNALAHRLPIWTTSVRMGLAHPINGVGARAFRYAYAEHASPDDIWLTTPAGHAMHAHQIVLEIWTETGAIGLLCWMVAVFALLRQWRRAAATVREQTLPWAIALLSMCFPINTHLAFYSNFWGMLFWWLLAAFVVLVATPDTVEQSKRVQSDQ